MQNAVGKPLDRVDGRAKVTGAARYAAEAPVKGVAYATIIQSTIASGTIRSIDVSAAKASPGVIDILTPQNKPNFKPYQPDFLKGGIPAEMRLPLNDLEVNHAGQHVALVVAKTPEQSRYAASLVKIEYESRPAALDFESPDAEVKQPEDFFGEKLSEEIGNVENALRAVDTVVHEATYITPNESHNPMEPSATVAVFEGDRLTVYDATQWIVGTRAIIADSVGLPRENVRVICPYVGGAFGCKGFIWPHTMLAVMAAKHCGVPVKLVLTRPQMFTSCGHRPLTKQTVAVGARRDGTVTAIRHISRMPGSKVGGFIEPCGMGTTRAIYNVPNLQWKHELVPLNLPEPTFMRAPGECPGSFALESAMDELAYKLGRDPLELRLKNHAKEKFPATGLPFSSNYLGDCYKEAAAKFGWSKRDPKPKSMTDNGMLVGYGMATATFPGNRFGGTARVRIMNDGRVIVSTAAHDIGTGAYTVLAQMAADSLGVDPSTVNVELGDSILPPGPLAGGSSTTATVSGMIVNAVVELAKSLGKPEARGNELIDAVKVTGKPFVEASGTSMPGPEMQKYAFHSFGAHFVEIAIDPLMPRVQVRRVVSMFDVGRIINPKTARSQVIGSIVMGVGMALSEETLYDPRTGRTMNDNLADYVVPVNADIGEIEAMFTDKPDPYFNPAGVRGLGEIAVTGIAAAIANAVYHATGVRVRELPIHPFKVV